MNDTLLREADQASSATEYTIRQVHISRKLLYCFLKRLLDIIGALVCGAILLIPMLAISIMNSMPTKKNWIS